MKNLVTLLTSPDLYSINTEILYSAVKPWKEKYEAFLEKAKTVDPNVELGFIFPRISDTILGVDSHYDVYMKTIVDEYYMFNLKRLSAEGFKSWKKNICQSIEDRIKKLEKEIVSRRRVLNSLLFFA